MPRQNRMSKIGCLVAALALITPATAAPTGDPDFVPDDAIPDFVPEPCISATAYHGPYFSPAYRWNNGRYGPHGKFMHISDIHFDELYKAGTDPAGTMCHRANADPSKNTAQKWGTISSICDTPEVLLDATFNWMKENTLDIDFILYTGDSARHDRDKAVPRQHSDVLYEHQAIVDKIQQTYNIKKVKFIPTWGNNDQLDYNKMADKNDPVIASLTDIWEPLGLNLDKQPEWLKGGYFSYKISPHLTVFSLNSMLLFKSNVLTKDCSVANSAGAEMLKWFENSLAHLRSRGIKAYVMQHVPPYSVKGEALYFPGCQKDYINLLGKYADVLLGSFYGHTNNDFISYVYTNNTQTPGEGPFFAKTVTDAVPAFDSHNTCVLHVLTQGPAIIPENNPAVRIFKYDTHARSYGGLINYQQYFSDIVKVNKEDKVEYETEYTSNKAYGLPNLSPYSWSLALKDWATNSTRFRDYVKYRYVQNPNPVLKG